MPSSERDERGRADVTSDRLWIPDHEPDAPGAAGGRPAVERVEDRAAAVEAIAAIVSSARVEALSTLPGGPYPVGVLRSSWETDLEVLRSGVHVLVIYQADAVREAGVLTYLTEFARAGARIRVARRVTQRMIVVDRRAGVLGMTEDSLRPPFLMIREAALVKQMCVQFGGLWRAAHSVGTGPEDALADETVREVVRALVAGQTDVAAARQLGISERTMRRRVAAVMDLLGASNRFEAGAKAAQHGWL